MSSQFNYELDERQIRMMMQDAELDYNDSVWNKFDELSGNQSKASASVGKFMPKFNLSISRSIIVPVIFIVLIGGLSAMLFSFVDFKKKESIIKEIPYVANVEPIKQPATKPKVVVKPKPVEVKTLDTSAVINTPSLTVATNSITAEPVVIKKEDPKITEAKPKEVIVAQAELKKEPVVHLKKKKAKVKTTEILPTINASTNTNLNEGAAEPELDLK